MKLDKAIEILDCILDDDYDPKDQEVDEAIKLGIEALKREQSNRKDTFSIPLPGETEEKP